MLVSLHSPSHTPDMDRDAINRICAAFPGAECSDPWGGGHDAWKVAGKMFACIGIQNVGISVKTDSIETAQMLIEAGAAERAPYFHRSWILVRFDTADRDEFAHRITRSYDIVRSKLPEKVQASLATRPDRL